VRLTVRDKGVKIDLSPTQGFLGVRTLDIYLGNRLA